MTARANSTPFCQPVRRPRWAAGLCSILLLLTLAACDSSKGLGPAELINATEQELNDINAALLDARDRIAPELHTADVIPVLQGRLSSLSMNLLARRRTPTTDALAAARKVLVDSEAAAPAEDAPERAAIHLALDQVQLLLAR